MAVTLYGLNAADLATTGGVTGDAVPASQAGAAGTGAVYTSTAAGGAQSDISLSSLSTSMAGLERSLTSGDAVSKDRVNGASAALASGTYSINAGSIATGLMQSEQLLGQLYGE